jgi:glycosyltransferase involved in cell wall biosynthesis
MHVITISLARGVLEEGSREFIRMQHYARHLSSYHVIVLTRKVHTQKEVIRSGNLYVYGTHTQTRFGMLLQAYRIGRNIISTLNEKPVLTVQDPLEIGWLGYLLSQVTRIPFHVQVHGDYFSSYAWVGRSPFRYIRRFYALVLLRRVHAIRVVSARIFNSLHKRGIAPSQMTILPIRPELEVFVAASKMIEEHSICTYGYIGRLAPEKNIARIIRAFAQLLREESRAHLRIVGSGPCAESLHALVAKLGMTNAVTFVPWTHMIIDEYKKIDVAVLASDHEAYALTLIEALALGIPIVARDVGCVGEVVIDGVHGLIVHTDTDAAFAHAMRDVWIDRSFYKNCSEAGKKLGQTLSRETNDSYARAWVDAIAKARRIASE